MEKSRSRAQENTRENATVNAKGKYETSHPVLSLRLTAGEMTKLKSAADKTGRKLTDIVKEGAGLGATTTDRAYQQGFKQGYREGFEEAKQKYAVYATCIVCGDSTPITDEKRRDNAGELYNYEYTCVHEGCQLPKDQAVVRVRRFKKEE